MSSHKDILLGLLVMLVWAGNTVVIKFITLELPPFTGLALRVTLASIIFLPFLRWPGKQTFIRLCATMFMLCVLHWGSLIWSIDKLEASMAAILLQIQVIFTVILGRFVFGETFGWRTACGIGIGIIGVVILVGLPQNPPAINGVLGMIFSMVTVAISYAIMKGIKDVSPTNYIAHMHLIPLIPVIALAFMFESPTQIEWQSINYKIITITMLYQVLLVSSVHMIWQRLMHRNKLSILPNLTLLLPIFGVVIAMIFLNEDITTTMLIGGLLTTCGVTIVMIRQQQKQKA
ncbi:MAG: DMT family transporter [Bdellovibrionales bacterium]